MQVCALNKTLTELKNIDLLIQDLAATENERSAPFVALMSGHKKDLGGAYTALRIALDAMPPDEAFLKTSRDGIDAAIASARVDVQRIRKMFPKVKPAAVAAEAAAVEPLPADLE